MLDSKSGSGGNRAMKAANIIAIGVGVAALGVSILGGPADAERWRQAVTDPAYPHVTVQSESYILPRRFRPRCAADRAEMRCGCREGPGSLAASIAISR
jgi:hypothetical protein